MDTGTITTKLRPIRLAFLVEPGDKKALAESIKINSILWGGMYNPIIPVFSKAPKVWRKNDPISKYKGKEILKGYLEAFEPDFMVPMGKCAKRKLDLGGRIIVTPEQILANFKKEGTPDYGVGVFEVLKDFFDEELKFTRRYPLDIHFFDFKKSPLFFSALFGEPFEETKKQLVKYWSSHLGAKQTKIDFSNYADYLKPDKSFLRRIMHHKIETSGRSESCFILKEADNK